MSVQRRAEVRIHASRLATGACWVLLVLLPWLAAKANALPHLPADLGGLDLLVLADRSESMSGESRHVRDLLVAYTLELVARSTGPGRVSHRLGVVSFGSSARIDLPMTEIRQDNLRRLRQTIDAISSQRDLGNTNFLAAFAAAVEVFDTLPADPKRRRAILLITDGVPYVPGMEIAQQSQDLRRFVTTNFPLAEMTVEALMLTSSGAGSGHRYRGFWRELSRGRFHELSRDRIEALAGLHQVVTGLEGVHGVRSRSEITAGGETVEALILPPYLDLVVFDILGENGTAEMALSPPEAQRKLASKTEGIEEIRLGRIIRTVVVRRPRPGLWTFRKSGPDARVKVLSQQFFPRGVLVDPASVPPLRQYEHAAIVYQVLDGDASPLQELPGYPLSLEVSLVDPKGGRKRLSMERRPEKGPGFFRTRRGADYDLSGRYWTEVVISTRDLSHRPVKVFEDRWSGFSVQAASRIDCRVEAPQPLGLVSPWRLLTSQPVFTRLKCLDLAGQPVDMESVVKGSPAGLIVTSLLHDDKPTAPALALDYLGGGVFQGRLLGAGSPGSYRLQLAIDKSRLPLQYNVRFLPTDIPFTRPLGELSWARHLSLLAMGMLLLLLLLLLWLAAGLR